MTEVSTIEATPTSKTCKECRIEKPLTEFYRDLSTKNGFNGRCKVCFSVYRKQYRTKKANTEVPLLKNCPKCNTEKPSSDFYRSRGEKDGLAYDCKECAKISLRKLRAKNKARPVVVPPDFKICPKCNLNKSKDEFHSDRSSKDGLSWSCKECNLKGGNNYRKNNEARKTVVIPDFRTCPKCNKEKPSSEFNKSNHRTDGLCTYCKECGAQRKRVQEDKNRERVFIQLPQYKKCPGCNLEKSGADFYKSKRTATGLNDYCKKCTLIRARKRKYGVSEDWVDLTFETQQGKCAICDSPPKNRRLQVDHDHLTNKPRGLLCGKCNTGLGHFKDNLTFLDTAKIYLVETSAFGIQYAETKGYANRAKAIRKTLLNSQNAVCKICANSLLNTKPCLDHCHKTGVIRGYLCNSCNTAIGLFNESQDIMNRAGSYLKKHKAGESQ